LTCNAGRCTMWVEAMCVATGSGGMRVGRTLTVKKDLCVACKRCEIECAVAHSDSENLYDSIRQRPSPKPRIQVEVVKGKVTPIVCRQCKNAACIEACPSGALARASADEPVLLDEALCTGCGACIEACPFGALRMDEERKVVLKCDLCARRWERGEEPACVVACLTGAVKVRKVPSS